MRTICYVFLHNDAGFCRYGVLCEIDYCMYKQYADKCENVDVSDNIDNELVNDVDETVNGLDPDESEDCTNRTFQNTSQFDKITSDEMFQYDWCDFVSENKSNLEKNQELSKICCSFFVLIAGDEKRVPLLWYFFIYLFLYCD